MPLVELSAVTPNQSNVLPEIQWLLVVVQQNSIQNRAQIHWRLDNLPIVGTIVSLRVDWLAEEYSIVDMVPGEV